MSGTDEKDVYLCYNSADLDWVRRLAEQIESETVDGSKTARHLTAFFDRWDIGPGESLIDRMNQGMKGARKVVAVLSPEFVEADWPRFEWKHIVSEDPNNARGRLIPVMLRDASLDKTRRIDPPAPFRELRWIDFRRPADFRAGFTELIRKIRNLAPERGRRLSPLASLGPNLPLSAQPEASWQPDRIDEFLVSNLLPVTRIPARVWSAPTPFEKEEEVLAMDLEVEAFIIRNKTLHTFADLNHPLERLRGAVSTAKIRQGSVHDWLHHKDWRRDYVALLNLALERHLRRIGVTTDDKGRFYFPPNEDGSDRCWPLANGRKRAVAAKKGTPEAPFWVHHSARMRFHRVEDRFYIYVSPAFLFTTDGTTGIGGKNAGRLSMAWGGKQQNPDILRNVLFWGSVLANNGAGIHIETGGHSIIGSPVPASARLNRGIGGDEVKVSALFSKADRDLEDAVVSAQDADGSDDSDDD